MRMVLLVPGGDEKLGQLKACFPAGYYLLGAVDAGSADEILGDFTQGVVLLDTGWPAASDWLGRAAQSNPGLIIIGLGSEKKRLPELHDSLYDFVPAPFDTAVLQKALDRAWEKTTLLAALKTDPGPAAVSASGGEQESCFSPGPWARVLSDFSRALSNQLNINRFVELFLNAVAELVPTANITLLLKSGASGEYFAAAQRGLDPGIQEQLRFNCSGGIMSWLNYNKRILNIPRMAKAGAAGCPAEIVLEAKLLRTEVCVPLVAHGRLSGALCLGPKVAGAPFFEKELELLYTICGNVAIALHDIVLHERLYDQKIYIESILQLMNSGVVAIDSSDRITTFNKCAGNILNLCPEKMIDRDLRNLPSPLGDMLFENFKTGKAYHNREIVLQKGEMPLEISTYRMANKAGKLLGSVMIFDDISVRKQVELEKRQVGQIEILNSFISQLMHEIRNPLVSIQTFSQLLADKYDDPDFRKYFSHTVNMELKRINELMNQLVAFASPLEYRYAVVDLHEVINHAIGLLNEQGKGSGIKINGNYTGHKIKVRVDQLSMARAISYLLNYLYEAPGNEKTINIQSVVKSSEEFSGAVVLINSDCLKPDRTEDMNRIFSPLGKRPGSTISLGLPVSKKIIEDHGGSLEAGLSSRNFLEFRVALPEHSVVCKAGE